MLVYVQAHGAACMFRPAVVSQRRVFVRSLHDQGVSFCMLVQVHGAKVLLS
jgi:hypothetical protein